MALLGFILMMTSCQQNTGDFNFYGRTEYENILRKNFYVKSVNELKGSNGCSYQVVLGFENQCGKTISGHASGHPTIFLEMKQGEQGGKWFYSAEAETIGFGTVGKPATILLPKQVIEFQIRTKSQERCGALHLGVRESFSFYDGPHMDLDFRHLELGRL